jgi:CheY-like chemotaxis protein
LNGSGLLLAGLVRLLDGGGFEVVATAGDGTALIEAVEREQPDLVIADSAVSKHINSIFAKLGLHPGDTGHRRVPAVLRYLGAAPGVTMDG